VQANSQTLVVITQIKPIYVVFSLPEADIPRIRTTTGEGRLTVQRWVKKLNRSQDGRCTLARTAYSGANLAA
jgi:hypothetical protein